PAGLPHSETHGSALAYSSPWIFAVNRVLHRLLVPRHPPCALSSLTIRTLSRAPSLSPAPLGGGVDDSKESRRITRHFLVHCGSNPRFRLKLRDSTSMKSLSAQSFPHHQLAEPPADLGRACSPQRTRKTDSTTLLSSQ